MLTQQAQIESLRLADTNRVIARHFEGGQESVAAKPKLYIRGQAANVATMASCPHCNTVVDLSQGSFCFNCGAPMKPKV